MMPPPAPLRKDDALFLDLDGTLAPIEPTPSDVMPDRARNTLLARLGKYLSGRIAIVSGRPIADVDRILDGAVAAVAGIHGLERRSASGATFKVPPDPALVYARAIFTAFADTQRGLIVEDKGASVALHYRGAPRAAHRIREFGRRLAEATGLVLQEGRMVVELRTKGPGKGDAIAAFMAEPPFAGARPIFVGDDLTDEAGFAIVEEAGGTGVLVGAQRPTRASHGFRNIKALFAWLKARA